MGIHATIFQSSGTCVTLYFLTIVLYTYAHMACIYEALPHYGHELSNHYKSEKSAMETAWLDILAGKLFWRIGRFESNPPNFICQKLQCDVIVIAES